MKRLLAAVAALVVLAGCAADVTSVTAPEPVNVAGTWTGSARWSALQDGTAVSISSQDASAVLRQDGILFFGQWEVTGRYVGTIEGTVDPAGNVTGTMTVTVLGVGACSASSTAGGTASSTALELRVSYADPGSTPCAGAPVGLVLELGR